MWTPFATAGRSTQDDILSLARRAVKRLHGRCFETIKSNLLRFRYPTDTRNLQTLSRAPGHTIRDLVQPCESFISKGRDNVNTKLNKLAGSAVLAGLLFAAASAQAVDLRSWDQKINVGAKRFIVLAAFDSEAVLDKETQLVWQRSPHPGYGPFGNMSAAQAHQYCGNLEIGGRAGWRLPSSVELMSLLDKTDPTGSMLQSGHPFEDVTTGGAVYSSFWSSTPEFDSSTHSVAVDIYHGDILYRLNSATDQRTWCVRGPSMSN